MEHELKRDGTVVRVAIEARDGRAQVTVDGNPVVVESYTVDARQIRIVTADGRHLRLPYARRDGMTLVAAPGRVVELAPHGGDAGDDEAGAGGFSPEVISPMPGKVLDVLVAVGDEVEHDAPLVRLEAMKMEQTIRAAAAARVREVRVSVGAMIGPGAVLLVLEALAET
jgi:3-methylcrotonyl-CoA carboxylase alpha subunit